MAEKTNISWTHSTFNPWIGCTKVGPGCDGCYAEAANHRFHNGANWGVGAPRRRTRPTNWKEPVKWNALAKTEIESGIREHWLVFCASQADVFDNEVPQEWRDDLWALIRETPYLTWQIVTKRIGNARAMLPPDWGEFGYGNVWLLATIVNQEEAERDITKLLTIPAPIHGVSYEPALGEVDWSEWLWLHCLASAEEHYAHHAGGLYCTEAALDWIIVGGESAQPLHPARPFVLGWGKTAIRQCREANVACFVKQLGSRPTNREGVPHPLQDSKGGDMSEWPKEMRVQEFPKQLHSRAWQRRVSP